MFWGCVRGLFNFNKKSMYGDNSHNDGFVVWVFLFYF